MSLRPIHIVTSGPKGAGKSYVRCAAFLVEEWLPDHVGQHISNFPVNFEPLRKFCDSRRNLRGIDLEKRITIMPQKVHQEFQETSLEPKEYFTRHYDLADAHIALDEFHTFFSSAPKLRTKQVALWRDFIGEIRHLGATIEFLSQDVKKIPSALVDEAEVRYELMKNSIRRDPWFNVVVQDWMELSAAMRGGEFKGSFFLQEYRQQFGTWKVQREKKYRLYPEYFKLYDSHNTPIGVKKAAKVKAPQPRWKKYGRLNTVGWFCSRNLMEVFPKVTLWGGAFLALTVFREPLINAVFDTVKQEGQEQAAGAFDESEPDKNEPDKKAKPKATREQVREAEKADLPERVKRLAAELDQQKEETRRFKQSAENLREIRRWWADELDKREFIVSLTPFHFSTKESRYEIGDTIKEVPFKGLRVEGIRFAERSVLLSDGSTVSLRLPITEATKTHQQRIAELLRDKTGVE